MEGDCTVLKSREGRRLSLALILMQGLDRLRRFFRRAGMKDGLRAEEGAIDAIAPASGFSI